MASNLRMDFVRVFYSISRLHIILYEAFFRYLCVTQRKVCQEIRILVSYNEQSSWGSLVGSFSLAWQLSLGGLFVSTFPHFLLVRLIPAAPMPPLCRPNAAWIKGPDTESQHGHLTSLNIIYCIVVIFIQPSQRLLHNQVSALIQDGRLSSSLLIITQKQIFW